MMQLSSFVTQLAAGGLDQIRKETTRFVLGHRRVPGVRLLCGLALLALTALFIRPGDVSAPEAEVFHAVNGLPGALFPLVWMVMQLGNVLVVPAAALLALAWRRVRLAAELAVSGTAAWALAKIVKQLIERGRPGQLLEEVILRGAPSGGHGYVSGHAAVASALAMVLTPYASPAWRAVIWVLAAGVAFARVYVGAHLPLDVVGGVALGAAIGSLVHVIVGHPRKQAEA
jgi:glycosyltransferase 2 family protein